MEPTAKLVGQVKDKNASWNIWNSTLRNLRNRCRCTMEYQPLMRGTCDHCKSSILNGAYCEDHDCYYCLKCVALKYKSNFALPTNEPVYKTIDCHLTKLRARNVAVRDGDTVTFSDSEAEPAIFTVTLWSIQDFCYFAIQHQTDFLQPDSEDIKFGPKAFVWYSLVQPLLWNDVSINADGLSGMNLLLFDSTGQMLCTDLLTLTTKQEWAHYFTFRLIPTSEWDSVVESEDLFFVAKSPQPSSDDNSMDLEDEDETLTYVSSELEVLTLNATSKGKDSDPAMETLEDFIESDSGSDDDDLQDAEKFTWNWDASKLPVIHEDTHNDLLFELAVNPSEMLTAANFHSKDYEVKAGLKEHFYKLLVKCKLERDQLKKKSSKKIPKNQKLSAELDRCIKKLYGHSTPVDRVESCLL